MKNRNYKNTITVCREKSSGKNFPATFDTRNNDICAEVYNWEEFYSFDNGELILEDTNVNFISLHNCIISPSAICRSGKRYNKNIVHSDSAVIGPSPWGISDKIKRIHFSIDEALELFSNGNILIDFVHKYRNGDFNSSLFSIAVSGYKITFNISFGINSDLNVDPIIKGINCCVEFNEPINLEDIHNGIWCVLSFVTLCLGNTILPKNVSISRCTYDKWNEHIEQNYQEDFKLSMHEVMWVDQRFGERFKQSRMALYRVNTEDEMDLFAAALKVWVQLTDTDWGDASRHMHRTLSLNQNHFTSERALNAFRWLESIPTFLPKKLGRDNVIDDLVNLVIEKTSEYDFIQDRGRINGLLSKLNYETFRKQIDRTIQELSLEFPLLDTIPSITAHLINSRLVRAKAAHGLLDWKVKDKIDPFKSVIALETLCFLLTMKELPRSDFINNSMEFYRILDDAKRSLR
ncbi:hypothetical protein [Alteromonas sp. C1M14]|uniref:hypothetical protein n=1 Tax=Alteromonas sp. C1M14 TaxID=2841567 RepID=UPI001C0899AE|nr:hypothetical protein [Alteromonas sp. C1M14]MBU2978913.1 hypothetical protein [Alteromonas sp. C1M14]